MKQIPIANSDIFGEPFPVLWPLFWVALVYALQLGSVVVSPLSPTSLSSYTAATTLLPYHYPARQPAPAVYSLIM